MRREILDSGPISLARFMEVALYDPDHGYYERPDHTPVGRAGDFYTSVSVGPLFGELLAIQFHAWLARLGRRDRHPTQNRRRPLEIVECGSHDGQLAEDVLTWFATHAPDRLDQFCYHIIEPSPRRQTAQRRRLARFKSHCRWSDSWEDVPRRSLSGIIVTNELLDAMPAHRLRWVARERRWKECFINDDEHAGGLIWSAPAEPSPALELPKIPEALAAVFLDGFHTEVSPAAERWYAEAADRLQSGWVLTIDYGLTDIERFEPHRSHGTLRAYRNHRLAENPLADPGHQDLTTHVNFSSLIQVGEAHGLKTRYYEPQRSFLSKLLTEPPDPEYGKLVARALQGKTAQWQTLTHPDFLGQRFKTLLQSRNVP